jgi:cell division protein FtsI/penicillin-binding protein 2
MRQAYVVRIRILLGVVIGIALLLVVRLYWIQIVHGDSFRAEAQQQYVRSTRDIFDRGTIYFTERSGKKIAAATLQSGFLLAIHPNEIIDPVSTYRTLHRHLTDIDEATFIERASRTDDPYEEITRHISEETADAIRAEDIPGVQLFSEKWRYYPGGELGAHALGFVGYGAGGESLAGVYGVEQYWNSILTRDDGDPYMNFYAELFTSTKKTIDGERRERPGHVVTTIEPAVQQALERTLVQAESEWHAKRLGGIIMDPKTGDILALASLPTYDPNTFGEEQDAGVFRNVMVEDVYEMGSIIKPIAMAIGLDTGAITAKTTYEDTGFITIDTATIRNYDGKARGVVDMQKVLNQSLNVGMAFVARKVGGEVMGERMRAFGFGEETGIDMPFEVRGLIENLNSPREVEYATAAFGQGIALTPIATARALSALGNGGLLVTPHVVKYVQYDDGTESNVAPEDTVQVLTKKTSEEITRMLVEVVDTALRGGSVKKERYSIAAKTGTAQIAKEGERGYYDDRYLHSLFGYFPAYDPKFMIFLFHVEPVGAQYASETLTDPFMGLVDYLINYYEIPPDR